ILALIFLALGVYGGVLHWRHDRPSFWFFGPLIFTVTLGLIYYLNFRYGASQAPELGENVPREVRDRDYFYLWSFSAWGVWAALGLVGLWRPLATLVAGREAAAARHRINGLPRPRVDEADETTRAAVTHRPGCASRGLRRERADVVPRRGHQRDDRPEGPRPRREWPGVSRADGPPGIADDRRFRARAIGLHQPQRRHLRRAARPSALHAGAGPRAEGGDGAGAARTRHDTGPWHRLRRCAAN